MKFGEYQVQSELGRGGMGVVYRARSVAGGEVAIKVLARSASGTALERFDRERRLQTSLGSGDGFVPLLEAGDSKEGPYIVMPLLGGGSLRDRLRRGPLGVAEALALARALADALARAHEAGVVHRDLKPENVLFDASGRPFIADLGLAKHFRRDDGTTGTISLTKDGALLGTIGYTSPEQAQDGKLAGPASDVFSLGAILHECLAGQACFSGANPPEVIVKLLNGRRSPLERNDVPGWLVRALDKALATDPAQRFADARAFRAALAEPKPEAERHLLFAALALAAVVAFVAVALAVRGRSAPPVPAPVVVPPPPSRPPPPTPTAPVLPPPARHVASDEVAALASRSLEAAGKNKNDEALELAERAIAADSEAADGWIARAMARRHLHRYDESLTDISRAIELDPRSPAARAERVKLYMRVGENEKALADLDVQVLLEPTDAKVLCQRSRVLTILGFHDRAIADATRALELAPGDRRAYAERGIARAEKGDHAGAIADLDDAIEGGANDPRTVAARGKAKLGQGDVEGALADLGRALKRDAKNGAALKDRALALLALGRRPEAVADLRQVIALGGGTPEAAFARKKLAELGEPER